MKKYGFFNAFKDLFKYSKENKKQYIIGTIFMIFFQKKVNYFVLFVSFS